MICDCGEMMKLVPAGTSKSTGKSYNAFYSCGACGLTRNTPTGKPVTNNKPSSMANPEMMRLAYRKDLMVAIIERAGAGTPASEHIDFFRLLWEEIEK